MRQILAVGIVTQTGAYFFLASILPRLGSTAMAMLAKEHAAAAAAAKTNSLLPLLLSSLATIFSPSTFEAFATTRLRRAMVGVAVGDCFEMEAAAEPARNEAAVMVMDAIA